MKQIFKLWYNPTPKKQSYVHKGYSISVEVDGMDAYYLNFMDVDSWYATTKSPQPVINNILSAIPAINQNRNVDEHMQLADFTSKHSHITIPRWTCVLDKEANTPNIHFINWDDDNKIFGWKMFKETNLNGNRRHTHVYVDDYNQLELQTGRKNMAA